MASIWLHSLCTKINIPSKSWSNSNLHRLQINRWFIVNGGIDISVKEMPLDTMVYCDPRKNGPCSIMAYLPVSYLLLLSLTKSSSIEATVEWRLKMKLWKDKAASDEIITHPKILLQRFSVKSASIDNCR